jgi:hypothetical protein
MELKQKWWKPKSITWRRFRLKELDGVVMDETTSLKGVH